jgi:hypothetical protein
VKDENKRRYKKEYAEEFRLAQSVLGESVEWSPHDYEAFRYKDEDVSLVFYPHRTTAGNYHIRIRDNGSKNKQRAIELMQKLDSAAGNNCTFSRKN